MAFFKQESNFERQIQNYYINKSKKELRFIQLYTAIYCLLRAGINLYYRSPISTVILWSVSVLLIPFVLQIFLRTTLITRNRTRKQLLISQLKEKIGVTVLFGIFLYAMLDYKNSEENTFISILAGADIVIFCLIFQIICSSWHSFTLFILQLATAILVASWHSKTQPVDRKIQITLRVVLFTFYTGAFLFRAERSFKDLFRYKMNLEENDSIHQEVLNLIPESIVLIDSETLEQKYFNKCFSSNFIGQGEKGATPSFWDQFLELRMIDDLEKGKALHDLEKDIHNLKFILTDLAKKPVQQQQTSSGKEGSAGGKEPTSPTKEGGKCLVYRGKWDKGESFQQTVEIKISQVLFHEKRSLLVVIRQAPEFQLLNQLEQASKYKDDILASVSHELRTPVNSNINLLDEAIKSNDVPMDIKMNLLHPALKSGKLLLNLVNDILDISQIREKKLRLVSQVVDLRTVLQECHYLFEHQCKLKKLEFTLTVDRQIPAKIRTDPNRLTQIVLNLLSNAYKFTSKGLIRLYANLDVDGLVKIGVTDTGMGIKKEDIGKLMKKFEKIDLGGLESENSTGAGLGLSIANSLAILLGPKNIQRGGLKFESEWGSGTTAWFILKSRKVFRNESSSNTTRMRAASGDSLATDREALQPLLSQREGTIPALVTEEDEQEENSSEFIDEEKYGEYHPYNFPIVEAGHKASPVKQNPQLLSPRKNPSDHPCCLIEENCSNCKAITSVNSQIQTSKLLSTACTCPPVLVVDDDSFNLFTMKVLLDSTHVGLETAHSGIECLEMVKNAKKCSLLCQRFKLIFLDGNMPVKDGYETAQELNLWNSQQQEPWKINIIGCTAHTAKEKEQEFFDVGAVDTVIKPLDKKVLMQLLQKYHIVSS